MKYIQEAEQLTVQDDLKGAKMLYAKATTLDPYNSEIWRVLGQIYYSEGKLFEAFNRFQGYLFHREEETQDPMFWFTLGDLYNRLEIHEYSYKVLVSTLSMGCEEDMKLRLYCKLGTV